MLALISVHQIRKGGRQARLRLNRRRVDPGIDLAPQNPRPLARRRDRPLRIAPDGHAPLTPSEPIEHDEGPAARGIDHRAEPAHIAVEQDIIVLAHLGGFDRRLRQFRRRHPDSPQKSVSVC